MASSATDFMKPSSWDKQLGLALLQEHAASQSNQTVNPSKNEVRNGGGAGYKSPHPHLTEGRGESFFLDILFYRISVIGDFSTAIFLIADLRLGQTEYSALSVVLTPALELAAMSFGYPCIPSLYSL